MTNASHTFLAHDIALRPRLGLALLAWAAVACAKGGEKSGSGAGGESARATAETTAAAPAMGAPAVVTPGSTATAAPGGVAAHDSTTPSPTSPAEPALQKTRAATPPGEAARLDRATRTAARQGAATRDTARTGAVTPAPAMRKTAPKPATPAPRDTNPPRAATPPARDTNPPRAGAPAGGAPAGGAPAGGAPAGGAPAGAGGQQAAGAPQGDDHLTASPAAYQGWKMFHVYCYRCHGVDAMGSNLAPNLRHSVGPEGTVTHDVFVTTVKEGRVDKGMPSWKALLTDEQIENLYAYLKARSSGALAAGRPRQGKPE